MHVHIFKYLFVAYREDYTRLFEFVSEKNLRVKNTGKAPVQTVSYNDDASSESGHDAYLERMKAEGEERDSEDGVCVCMCVFCDSNNNSLHCYSITLIQRTRTLLLEPVAVKMISSESHAHTHTHTHTHTCYPLGGLHVHIWICFFDALIVMLCVQV